MDCLFPIACSPCCACCDSPNKGGTVGGLNQLRAKKASSAASATQRLSLLATSRPEVGQPQLGGGGGALLTFEDNGFFLPRMVVCASGLSLKYVGMPTYSFQALQAVRRSNIVLITRCRSFVVPQPTSIPTNVVT
jgi:hypothetical protein